MTAFSDGEADYLVSLDASSGVEQWRYRISDAYKGHDGSDDGPLATPAIAGAAVPGRASGATRCSNCGIK